MTTGRASPPGSDEGALGFWDDHPLFFNRSKTFAPNGLGGDNGTVAERFATQSDEYWLAVQLVGKKQRAVW